MDVHKIMRLGIDRRDFSVVMTFDDGVSYHFSQEDAAAFRDGLTGSIEMAAFRDALDGCIADLQAADIPPLPLEYDL